MERPQTKQSIPPGGRAEPARFTPRQAVTLTVFAALALLLLLTVVRLLFPPPVSSAPHPVVTTAETPAALLVTSTTVPLATLAPRQLLPAGCEPIYGSLVESATAQVVDGQTLDVFLGETLTRIRLAGIALPEAEQIPGTAAAELQAMIDGQPVILALDSSLPDEQGRLPAYVFSSGWFLNQELILRGMARTDLTTQGQACAMLFQESERRAQSARAGIWQPTRVPTATFVPTVQLPVDPPCSCIPRPVCTDFVTHDEAQACYNACMDYNTRLDPDHDGLACENLP
jgi:endonuclease YncB( thermonuclease family)